MSELAKRFPPASFAGIKFPFTDCSVKCSLRHHVHEYPHTPGGDPEELGRKLYEIRFTSDFHDVFRTYPGLYPEALLSLRGLFEQGQTDSLVIPSIGAIKAKCIDWSQRLTAKILSGEKVELTFLEDAAAAALITALPALSTAALAPLMASLDQFTVAAGHDKSLFDGLRDAVGFVTGISDQAELYGNLLDSKAQGIMQLCDRLDRLPFMGDPAAFLILDLLHEIHASALQLHTDALKAARPIDLYRAPSLMTITQVSVAIYGSTKRAMELLQLNVLDDAFAIPEGKLVRFYA